MGHIERQVRQRVRKQNIRYAILAGLKAAGIVSMGVIAPNTLKLLKYAPGMGAKYASRISSSFKRLESRGLVRVHEKGGNPQVVLTKAGEALLARLSAAGGKLKRPRTWDRRWRVVIFDIPERRKAARDRLRLLLSSIGFAKLQNSVWVYPFECEDLLTLLKSDAALGREVLYIVAEEIENDRHLRIRFKLAAD